MIPNEYYRVTSKIKVHTSPTREIEYEREGKFIKETTSLYKFDTFIARKENVINIVRRQQ